MKRFCLLILVCLLLCGCAAESTPGESTSLPPVTTIPTTAATEPAGFYEPASVLEEQTSGAVRTYPLDIAGTGGVIPMGEDLLVLSAAEGGTVLTVLSGEQLFPSARCQLSFTLTPETPSLRVSDTGLSFYYEKNRQMVTMDTALKEVSHIPAPEDMIGTPVLSADRNTLYYCTPSGIRAWDLATGIRRILKEVSYPVQTVTGLWLGDTVVQCRISENDGQVSSLFLSAKTGETLYMTDADMDLVTTAERYYAIIPVGAANSLIYGRVGESPMELQPHDLSTTCFFLAESHAAVTIAPLVSGGYALNYYDLSVGKCTASLPMPEGASPWYATEAVPGIVYALAYDESSGIDTLYRWDTAAMPPSDSDVFTDIHHTAENPDYAGLAECQLYADDIGSRYGIEVLIFEDATTIQPWDYDMETEHIVSVIQRELELLDSRLANYPDGMLAALSECFGNLRICMVRSLTGTAESGSLDTAAGIQFFNEHGACIALAADQNTEYALYHELCHLIDTKVLNESNAYDSWEELNPDGFQYDYDYAANAQRDSGAYLLDSSRSFIDTYAMSYPKEDRARVMEYAMTEGNEAYFQSPTMQAKLKKLCEGIRDAFGLKKSPEVFLWEQYLAQSLAYTDKP